MSVVVRLPVKLSEMEYLLLGHLLKGRTLTEVARERGRSMKTVSTQKMMLYKKLGVRNDLTLWRDVVLPQLLAHSGGEGTAHTTQRDRPDTVVSVSVPETIFVPWFQPVVCAFSGRMTGCEVLLRHGSSRGEREGASQFIAALEMSGQMASVTSRMMMQVADVLAPVAGLLPAGFRVGINVDAETLLAPSLVRDCVMLQERMGKAVHLVLELTERTLLAETQAVRERVSRLKAAGVGLALDDFGTGYSTYRTLQRVVPELIKLDKSFVQRAGKDAVAGEVVDSVVSLARRLNMDVVAEGVETREQAVQMAKKGVRYLQGYWFSAPLPGDVFIAEWVKAGNSSMRDI